MATHKLEVEIGANISKLVETLREGQEQVKDFANSVNKSTSDISDKLTNAVLRIDSNILKIVNEFKNLAKGSKSAGKDTSDSLKQTGDEAEKASKKVKKLKNDVDDLNKSLNTAKLNGQGVAMEFSRIVQDAPFGFMGIGNNIQQLTQNFATLRAQAGSTGAALKASFASLFSGTNLLVLGISAVTSAITFYQMWAQRANKETKNTESAMRAAKKATDEYIASLDSLSRLQVVGARNAAEEMATLRILYKQTQDVTLSTEQRKDAVDQLQKLYPAYFKNMSDESIMAGNASNAYNRLSTSIIATAKARAGLDIITENSRKQFENEQRVLDLTIERQQALVKLEKQRAINSANIQMGTGGVFDTDQLIRAENAITDIENEIVRLKNQNKELNEDNLSIEKMINVQIANGARLTSKVGQELDKVAKKRRDIANKDVIEQSLRVSQDSSDMSGLLGNDRDVEKVRQRYAKLYADIDKYVEDQAKKGVDVSARASEAKITLATREAKEQADISIAEQLRVAEEIQRIQAQSGVKSAETKAKELAQLDKWYKEEVVKAQGNADILLAIEEGRKAQEQAINDKYEKKKADITLQYTRRLYETQSQILTRQLNERYKKMADQAKKEVKTQEEALARQKQLQEQYWQQLDAIRKIEQLEQLSISLGDAVGNAFERMLTDGTNVFQALANEFKRMIIQMVAQTAAIKVTNWIGGLLGIGKVLTGGGGLGSLLGGLIGGGSVMSASKAIPSATPMAGLSKLTSSSQSMNVNVTGEIRNNVISLSNKKGLENNTGGR